VKFNTRLLIVLSSLIGSLGAMHVEGMSVTDVKEGGGRICGSPYTPKYTVVVISIMMNYVLQCTLAVY